MRFVSLLIAVVITSSLVLLASGHVSATVGPIELVSGPSAVSITRKVL